MLFSSIIFLYLFLPLSLVAYLLNPKVTKNLLLLFASLLFYAWGNVSHCLILLGSIGLNYGIGLMMHRYRDQPWERGWLSIGISINLLVLIIFKYANFFIDNLNLLIEQVGGTTLEATTTKLPIGISFFTFQAISYLVDVYRRNAPVEKNSIDLALYIALFPQLVAGPIVRFRDINRQLKNRTHSLDLFSSGIERFLVGLGKKVLLANQFALVADQIFSSPVDTITLPIAWLGALLFTLQIYFDFSGYSDMAIGLGRMFGFQIPENFNFPYIAKSIRDFWRRWHISLSQWFRDYLYISLGGNRKGKAKTIRNLLIVFFLTGLWHGASWNFVIWGMLHGLFMLVERLGFGRWLKKAGPIIGHFYTLLIVIFTFTIFRLQEMDYLLDYLKTMAGLNEKPLNILTIGTYANTLFYALLLIGLLACTPLFKVINQYFLHQNRSTLTQNVYQLLISIGLIITLIWSTVELLMHTYQPFIYYQF